MSLNNGQFNPSGATGPQLAAITNKTVVALVADTYTFNLNNEPIKNFECTSADANAKIFAFSNINTALGLIQATVHFICTTGCAITHPTGATFATAPTFATGKKYNITYVSWDGGTSFEGFCQQGGA